MYIHFKGETIGFNADVECNPFCSHTHWSDESTKMAAVNVDKPPIKDTISVPRSGYILIRFKTLNPGYWYLHCHQQSHHLNG